MIFLKLLKMFRVLPCKALMASPLRITSSFTRQVSTAVSTKVAHRSIVRYDPTYSSLVMTDKEKGSFDPRDAPLQPVNPFNLPASANNAAGTK